MLLHDKIMRLDEREKIQLFHTRALRVAFEGAPVIQVDNVAVYMTKRESKVLEARDMPNVAPPFEHVWIEHTALVGDFTGHRVGTLLSSVKKEDQSGWVTFASLFVGRGNVVWELPWTDTLESDQDGFPVGMGRLVRNDYESDGSEAEDEMMGAVSGAIIAPAYLSLSFMHCKNVEMVENVPPKLPMTKKRAQHPPRTKFYTLNIKPMQRILEDEGQASKTGLKMALHICRGHFKDYRDGGGLFGKYKGMYWWESQVRGDRKHGEVVKDYRVQPQ